MGCDIHIGIESLRKTWSMQDRKFHEPAWKFCHSFYSHENDEGGGYYEPCIYGYEIEARQYGFFARLAGVRNGFGVQELFPGRGLPGDLDRKIGEDFYADHSYTWATLREITDADWGTIKYHDGDWDLKTGSEFLKFAYDLRKRIEEGDFQVLYYFLGLGYDKEGGLVDQARFIFGFDS